MIEESVASGGPRREEVEEDRRARGRRGLALWLERGEEIAPLGGGVFTVPGCDGRGPYTVDLGLEGGRQSCTCRDFRRRRRPEGCEPDSPCKHLIAATIYAAKVGTEPPAPTRTGETRAESFRALRARVRRRMEPSESAASSYALALETEAFYAPRGTVERALRDELRRRAWARHRAVLAALNEAA